ncbi:Polyadenylate-binding protein-interacting protein 7-like protein [Drosera capensis]
MLPNSFPYPSRVVPPGTASRSDGSSKFLTGSSSGKRLLERSESSISTNSEEETRQYWQRQLPDDLIPDFNVSAGVGSERLGAYPNGLSAVMDTGYLLKQQLDLSPHHANGTHMADKAGYPRSSCGDNPSPTYFTDRPIKPRDKRARQAYLIGNKALAKELSVKGQLHNMQMKAAHHKAQESIYQQRNASILELQSNGKGQEKMIDLHGLRANEAIHVLKHELAALRSAARSAGQRLPVYICVGTGHHTRGSRTPARLPIAVQRYLLEDEGLDYSRATTRANRTVWTCITELQPVMRSLVKPLEQGNEN